MGIFNDKSSNNSNIQLIINNLQLKIQYIESENRQLQLANSYLQSDIVNLQSQIVHLQEENNKLKSRNNDVQTRNVGVQLKKLDLQKENNELKDKIKELQERNSQLQSHDCKTYHSENEALQQENIDLKNYIKQLNNNELPLKYQELKSLYDELQTKNNKLQSEIEAIKISNENLQLQNNQLTSKLSTEANKKDVELRKEYSLLDRKYKKLNNIFTLLNNKYAELEEINKDLYSQYALLQIKSDIIIDKNKELQARDDELHTTLINITNSNDKESMLNMAILEINRLTGDNSILYHKEELHRLLEQKIDIITKNEKIINDLESNTQLLNNLNTEISSKNNELKLLNNELALINNGEIIKELKLTMQEFKFDSDLKYKDTLVDIRKKQLEMINNNDAIYFVNTLSDKRLLGKIIEDFQKFVAYAFNTECNNIINSKITDYDTALNKLIEIKETVSKLSKSVGANIDNDYFSLKVDELKLVYEYQQKYGTDLEPAIDITNLKKETKKLNNPKKADNKDKKEVKSNTVNKNTITLGNYNL